MRTPGHGQGWSIWQLEIWLTEYLQFLHQPFYLTSTVSEWFSIYQQNHPKKEMCNFCVWFALTFSLFFTTKLSEDFDHWAFAGLKCWRVKSYFVSRTCHLKNKLLCRTKYTLNFIKGEGNPFWKTTFHGQIRANPKGKKSEQVKKIQILGQKALKSAKIRTKWQTFFGTTI